MGCIVVFYVFFTVAAFLSKQYAIGAGMLVLLLVGIGIKIWMNRRKKERLKAERVERERLLGLKKRAYEERFVKVMGMLGKPSKSVAMEQYNLDREVVVFEETDRVWICGKAYPMRSILGCMLENNHSIIRSDVVSTTKTDTGSMLGRSIVGGVAAGDAGAIVGGTTASMTTISKGGVDKISHNYTIIVYVDSLVEPTISIHTGTDSKKTNEIVGLMNVIISRNSRKG